MARDSCLTCARKHVAEAEILLRESRMGYVLYAFLAVGHLSQAEAELIKDYPEMAHTVRAERLNLIDGINYKNKDDILILDLTYDIDTMKLLEEMTILSLDQT